MGDESTRLTNLTFLTTVFERSKSAFIYIIIE